MSLQFPTTGYPKIQSVTSRICLPLFKDLRKVHEAVLSKAAKRAIRLKPLLKITTELKEGNTPSQIIAAVADGIYVFNNVYNHEITAIGKGPSALMVEAPKVSIELGKSLVISGMVTDIAAGTKQNEQAARFPNGVPAVSDASQSQWMEYVYMQKPRPTDVTGVDVILSVLDSNGNFRKIGTTTSDSNGFYSYQWTPDISGKYTVYASFGGSESYWPSHAETAFAVDPAAATPAPTAAPVQSTADIYFVPAVAGIILAIFIVGAIIVLMLRKRP